MISNGNNHFMKGKKMVYIPGMLNGCIQSRSNYLTKLCKFMQANKVSFWITDMLYLVTISRSEEESNK